MGRWGEEAGRAKGPGLIHPGPSPPTGHQLSGERGSPPWEIAHELRSQTSPDSNPSPAAGSWEARCGTRMCPERWQVWELRHRSQLGLLRSAGG